MLTTKYLQEQKRDKKIPNKENNDTINTVIANKQQLEDDAQALSTKEAELKVAQLIWQLKNHLLKTKEHLCRNKKLKRRKKAAAAAASSRSGTVRSKGTTSSCEASANTTLQAQSSAKAHKSTCCNTSSCKLKQQLNLLFKLKQRRHQ